MDTMADSRKKERKEIKDKHKKERKIKKINLTLFMEKVKKSKQS